MTKNIEDELEPERPLESDEIEILEIEGMPGPASAPAGAEIEVLFDEKPDAAAEARDQEAGRERLLRLQADFDNLRKRVEREQAEFQASARCRVVGALLPVLDNFDRAVASGRAGGEDEAFRLGIELIHRQFVEILSKEGLRPVEALGRPFDPLIHEAVATDSASGLAPNTVIEEIQRGYFLNERLLRPSLVRVAVGEPADAAGSGPQEGQ